MYSHLQALLDSPEALAAGTEYNQVVNEDDSDNPFEGKPLAFEVDVHPDQQEGMAVRGTVTGRSSVTTAHAPLFSRACKEMPRNFRISVRNSNKTKLDEAVKACFSSRGRLLSWQWEVMVKYILAAITSCDNEVCRRMGLQEVDVQWDDEEDFLEHDYRLVNSRVKIRTGFIFADEIMGMNARRGQAVSLLVNPLQHPTMMAWIRDKEISSYVPEDLFATAVHEVAHLAEGAHDMSFIETCDRIRELVARTPWLPEDMADCASRKLPLRKKRSRR